MINQRFKYVPAIAAFVLALGVMALAFVPGMSISAAPAKTPLVVTGAAHPPITFNVEAAITRAQLETGLMYRDHINPDYGMLFMFDHPSMQSMWMHNTRVSLDMLFMDEAGRVIKIHENARPFDDTPIESGGPVKAILEIQGGQAAKAGLKVGDQVTAPPYLPAN